VALAAAKALATRSTEQQQRMDALEQENAVLRDRLERLEKLILDHQH
jgi:uncharacterized protein YceH (UPF0502 family)